jgi:uncharacterized protein YqjF (DUF2071 family)
MDAGAPARQARSLQQVEHRPWPLPSGRWTLGQTWEDLLFAHWPVALDEIRAHVPDGLEIELHGGSAWLGITPFRMTGLRARGMLPLPGLSSFLGLNVRTYVHAADGKPGVWLLGADVSSRLVAAASRRLVKLPYFYARMSAEHHGGWIEFECVRVGERGRVFSGRYRAAGEVFTAQPDSLEWFLTERYCVYTVDARGVLYRSENHHGPWPLQRAEAELDLTTIAPLALDGTPLCHFSARQDVLLWPLEVLAHL